MGEESGKFRSLLSACYAVDRRRCDMLSRAARSSGSLRLVEFGSSEPMLCRIDTLISHL